MKSNILKVMRKSEIVEASEDPTASWPSLIGLAELFPVVTTDPGQDSTIVQATASWTTPTSAVTLVFMAGAVQDSATAPDSGYEIIKEVPGVDETFEDLGLGSVYSGFFGFFVPGDAGRYVPYRIKFVDEYDREQIVKTDVGIIVSS